MTKQEALNKLKASKNHDEWNQTVDAVKAANNGQYPDWWFPEVIQTNLANKTFGPGADGIKVSAF
jgi:hypothetical protein